jgi:hypothetical protein
MYMAGIIGNLTSLKNSALNLFKKNTPSLNAPTTVNFYDRTGTQLKKDHRVRIQVPAVYGKNTGKGASSIYHTQFTQGDKFQKELSPSNGGVGGIIFPYTPQITLEHKADYTTSNQMHSNFAQHFYQRSSVSPITITGKFTVQDDEDANVYLSTIHMLRGLTKMHFGPDANAGSPPPVCKLYAWGSWMLWNIPVVVTSFRNELPDTVDYYSLSTGEGADVKTTLFQDTMVPVVSSITVTLLPMYSRREQQTFGVENWFNGQVSGKGYL